MAQVWRGLARYCAVSVSQSSTLCVGLLTLALRLRPEQPTAPRVVMRPATK
jgi:hypothetical protein